ncbi:ParA family protein [Solemya velesiana gill symbiont]|uniref:AAA domain-containing protein n=1 Tax=Solemya velesiana gill symbiont TaxID=1918948 RepID=A0A1T2KMF9_9GAMM|nr:AAA family ATPase [Solemya velesiana gill symbiont]OOZ34064.1 hypothetical protein BOW51_12360 [Solemya velesiana gill symbiont]
MLQTGSLDDCISQTTIKGSDFVYSNEPEGKLQNWIMQTPDGRFRIKRALTNLRGYDFVIIDTQGAVGGLQDAAVIAADELLSPIWSFWASKLPR